MANSVDPDQTAIGAVCSGSTVFASVLLKFVGNVRQSIAADDFSRQHFQIHFFFALYLYSERTCEQICVTGLCRSPC